MGLSPGSHTPILGVSARMSSKTRRGRARRVTDTPLCRVASVICFASDFPLFTAGVGRAGAELWLVTAFDWEGIHTIHSRMARLRAVEEGAPLFQITSHAQSVASDPYGQVLASADDQDGANDGIMVAMLPSRHAWVLAPTIMGWILPLSAIGLIALAAIVLLQSRQPSSGR